MTEAAKLQVTAAAIQSATRTSTTVRLPGTHLSIRALNTSTITGKRTAGYDPGTVEYAIAKKGGKIIKRADGIEERTADADAYVDSVLEAMGAPVAKRQGTIHVGVESDDESLKKRQGIIHVNVADTAGEDPGCEECM